MEKGRYMLIYMDKYIYRFDEYEQAENYAVKTCCGRYVFYIIVDTKKDVVVSRWRH